ncbi:unnamed protein product [Phaeothamnion confervicola]
METDLPKLEYSRDWDGTERLILSDGKPTKGENTVVMMAWEEPLMRTCVDSLGITSKSEVLEIGFGMGFSSERIQEHNPKSHTIIEVAPAVLTRLEIWATDRCGVVIVADWWQSALPSLGRFDCVFFDDFPLPGAPDAEEDAGGSSRWHAFAELCAAHHLKPGGRITGYMAREIDLRIPGCDVSFSTVAVAPPPSCPYYPYTSAVVPLVTLRDLTVANASIGSTVPPSSALVAHPDADSFLPAQQGRSRKRRRRDEAVLASVLRALESRRGR